MKRTMISNFASSARESAVLVRDSNESQLGRHKTHPIKPVQYDRPRTAGVSFQDTTGTVGETRERLLERISQASADIERLMSENDLSAIDVQEKSIPLWQVYFSGTFKPGQATMRLLEICHQLAVEALACDDFAAAESALSKAESATSSRRNDLPWPSPQAKLRMRAVTLRHLGMYNQRVERFRAALDSFKSAFQIYDHANDQLSAAYIRLDICALQSKLGKHDIACKHAERALKSLHLKLVYSTSVTSELVCAVALAYHNLAVEQEHLGLWELCMQNYRKGALLASERLGASHQVTQMLNTAKASALKDIPARRLLAQQRSSSPSRLRPSTANASTRVAYSPVREFVLRNVHSVMKKERSPSPSKHPHFPSDNDQEPIFPARPGSVHADGGDKMHSPLADAHPIASLQARLSPPVYDGLSDSEDDFGFDDIRPVSRLSQRVEHLEETVKPIAPSEHTFVTDGTQDLEIAANIEKPLQRVKSESKKSEEPVATVKRQAPPTLLTLPESVLLSILSSLTLGDLHRRVALTCKRLHELTQSATVSLKWHPSDTILATDTYWQTFDGMLSRLEHLEHLELVEALNLPLHVQIIAFRCHLLKSLTIMGEHPDAVNSGDLNEQLRSLLGINAELRCLQVIHVKCDDSVVHVALEQCHQLEELHLPMCVLNRDVLLMMNDLGTHLQELTISCAALNLADIELFLQKRGGQMRSLALADYAETDEPSQLIATYCTKLVNLTLTRHFNLRAVASMTWLRQLKLLACNNVTDFSALTSLVQLQSLTLYAVKGLTDERLNFLTLSLRNLTAVRFTEAPLTKVGIILLGRNCTGLQSLTLSGYTDDFVLPVADEPLFAHLTKLELEECANVQKDSIVALSALPVLRSLHLYSCAQMCAVDWFALGFAHLRELTVSCPDDTRNAIATALPVSLHQHEADAAL